MASLPCVWSRKESRTRGRTSDRQVAVLTRQDFVDSDLAVEDRREYELVAIIDGVAGASGLDIGFHRRGFQPQDGRDVGITLALPCQHRAFALTRLKARGANLPQAAAIHDPPRLLKGKRPDRMNGVDLIPDKIGRPTCGERGGLYVLISVGACFLTK